MLRSCNRDEYDESHDEHVRLSKAHDASGEEQLPLGSLASANAAAKAKLKELVNALHLSIHEDCYDEGDEEDLSALHEQARAAVEAAAASTPTIGAGGHKKTKHVTFPNKAIML